MTGLVWLIFGVLVAGAIIALIVDLVRAFVGKGRQGAVTRTLGDTLRSMTDRNAVVGSILAAAGIVVTGFGIGYNHLSEDMSVLHAGLQELREDVREIRTLLIDHLDEHPTDND